METFFELPRRELRASGFIKKCETYDIKTVSADAFSIQNVIQFTENIAGNSLAKPHHSLYSSDSDK